MECGKLTAKLRDALPVCLIEDGKEIKRFKNIEIPDEIKKLPYQDFEFSVPVTGAITFKIMFEEGVLPKVWPEAQTRKSRKAKPEDVPIPLLKKNDMINFPSIACIGRGGIAICIKIGDLTDVPLLVALVS